MIKKKKKTVKQTNLQTIKHTHETKKVTKQQQQKIGKWITQSITVSDAEIEWKKERKRRKEGEITNTKPTSTLAITKIKTMAMCILRIIGRGAFLVFQEKLEALVIKPLVRTINVW